MTRTLWLLALPALLCAADDPVARGAAIYRTTCAVAYCHGPEGKASRAPALAGRGLDARAIVTTATTGIPNTSMPSFAARLKTDDLIAVAMYIVSLGGGGSARSSAKPAAPAPAEVQPGRSLFFDAGRIGACGSCHEVGGIGIPVSVALQDIRTAHLGDLRAVQAPDMVTAKPAGEPAFPAVVIEKSAAAVRVYDVSSALPVLRTFAAAQVTLAPGASWKHTEAVSRYTDAELAEIAKYLRWAAAQ